MAGQLHETLLLDSPTVVIGDVRCRPRGSGCGGEELSDGNDIVFPRRGHFVRHVGGYDVVGDANQVLFFNRGEVYRVSHPVGGGDDCTFFSFGREVLVEALERYEPAVGDRGDGLFSFTHAPTEPGVFLLGQRLRRFLCGPHCDAMSAEQGALDLLDGVIEGAYCVRGLRPVRMKQDTHRVHRELADAAKTVLGRRFREHLSLDGVARAVCSSPYHLARVFRRVTGMAVHQYQNRLRLRASLESLAEGRSGLTELALDLGYSSHSHFSDAFGREFGTSPSSFRRSATPGLPDEMSTILKD